MEAAWTSETLVSYGITAQKITWELQIFYEWLYRLQLMTWNEYESASLSHVFKNKMWC
jgi:hypothetical protein